MSGALLIAVRLHDGRYHGARDWPPAPARLFQALVAGVGLGGPLLATECEALRWLERKCEQAPPIIGAPTAWFGQQVMLYMPNNDLDRVGGDPHRTAEIRTAKKFFKPHVFDPAIPFLYAWSLDATEGNEPNPHVICTLADRLYQFGRGIDMAWAWAELLDGNELDARLASYEGRIYRPSGGGEARLLCPQRGSFASISVRYRAYGTRLGLGDPGKQLFTQPPKPRFAQVAYESQPRRQTFALCKKPFGGSFFPYAQARAYELVMWIRDEAVQRLRKTLPARHVEIERVLIGRKADGSNDGPASERVRIVPLPSIGHEHVDRGIRRVLVEVPSGCALGAEDVWWAVSGIDHVNTDTGEVDFVITPADEDKMLPRYLEQSRVWRTVTPAALPEQTKRRRIDPTRRLEEPKGGDERMQEQRRAAGAVVQALRHADVRAAARMIRVQREPFERQGARADAFAEGTRFAKERLCHVEITFDAPVSGPLVIGDGRFLGLGVMAPVSHTPGIHVFAIEAGLLDAPVPEQVSRALRRAVMARAQGVLGPSERLPAFFSGHEHNGSPVRSERTSHLSFVFDEPRGRLLVVAPHVLDRREPTREEKKNLAVLDQALEDTWELRAGLAGHLRLRAMPLDLDTDPLTVPSRTWESSTMYCATRHAKKVTAADALCADIRAECRRRGLPEPAVTVLETRGMSGVGLMGRARLFFQVAVPGPIFLGRSRYSGGGVFAASISLPC